MAGSTEIYICKPGQALTDGRVEYGEITTKTKAEGDAIERMRCDSSIGKIAYYAMSPNGDFKCIHTRHNPDAVLPTSKPPAGFAPRSAKPCGKKVAKPSLMDRALNLLR
ncbi:MAG: hypothetical protein HQ514_19790 [Rhodospirillales bacterium]|nr:hypothetical protein [Rhodospirillales bacterium]